MRRLLLWLALLAGLVATAITVVVLATAAELPDLSTQEAIEAHIERAVQAARRNRAARTNQLPAPFAVDDQLYFSPAGKAVLAAFGCPAAPGASPESEREFTWRALQALRGAAPEAGPGGCELVMARGLADFLGLSLPREKLLAAARIRSVLPHHELLALWGSTYAFGPEGPFGFEAAAQQLFGKPAAALNWNEAALMALATDYFAEVQTCRHPPRLTALRDGFLQRLAQLYPDQANQLLLQKQLPLPCDRPAPTSRFADRDAGSGLSPGLQGAAGPVLQIP